MKRRNFVKALSGIGITGLATSLYTWQIEPYWVEFVNLPMPIKHLPNKLIGKKLVQISDMHVGNRFDWHYLIDSLKKVQVMNPDFVVYTGDFVSYESSQQFDQLAKVFEHKAIGKLGTFGVLGNHDYGYNWAEPDVANNITDVLESAGVHILRNEIKDATGLNIIGIDDYWGTNYHPSSVMEKTDVNEASIVLCHNPDVADQPVWHNYQGWILSGHTHGGQCKPPFLPPPILPVKNSHYTSGKIDLEDGRLLYINRALGCMYPIRFNVRPEITIFTLEQASTYHYFKIAFNFFINFILFSFIFTAKRGF
ncbi:MAG: metallophosphoesterase [Bacteroidota bacterium]